MPFTGLKPPIRRFALIAALLGIWISGPKAPATEPYRVLSRPGEAPYPAVLLVPGCSGFVEANGVNLYDERAEELQGAGYLVVFVDYLGRHNLTECRYVSRAQVGQDILEAANWTRSRVDVDPSRVSVIGWSYGGGGVLAALAAMPPGPPIFVKAVMYYPDCRSAKPWSAVGISVLMLMGAIDEVARPALCDSVAQGTPPNSVRTILYPNAYHSFDVRSLPERAEYSFGTIGYNAEAAKASWATVLDFLK
jgi:dienelactone hydrolase